MDPGSPAKFSGASAATTEKEAFINFKQVIPTEALTEQLSFT